MNYHIVASAGQYWGPNPTCWKHEVSAIAILNIKVQNKWFYLHFLILNFNVSMCNVLFMQKKKSSQKHWITNKSNNPLATETISFSSTMSMLRYLFELKGSKVNTNDIIKQILWKIHILFWYLCTKHIIHTLILCAFSSWSLLQWLCLRLAGLLLAPTVTPHHQTFCMQAAGC